MHAQPASQWTSIAISAAVVCLILFFRIRRMGQARRLRIETLWIVPVVLGGVIAWVFTIQPPHGLAWLYSLVALLFGGALGWQRGRLMTISVDPETHELNQSISPAAMIFLVLLIVLRMGTRTLAMEMNAGPATITLVTDLLMAFALGMLTLQRVEMYIRARRLLDEARASRQGA